MSSDYIDFISAYCDRWCERCRHTSRCSAYAARAAIAMCGDDIEGLLLAVGAPASVRSGPAKVPDWIAELDQAAMSPMELAEFDTREEALRQHVDSHPAVAVATAVSSLAHRWFRDCHQTLHAKADPIVDEALAVVTHDALLIPVKLRRAVAGRDRRQHGEDVDEHPVQNDWNGSAKLVLICLERSIAAWDVIAAASGGEIATAIAEQLRSLQSEVEQHFPAARAFIRPGFDDTDE